MALKLITDRTKDHVSLLNRLRKKRWSEMTTSEQKAWYNEAAKGAYNYTDLNRVETAVATLARSLGLSLTTKTNWTLWDIPTQKDMDRYLQNVVQIKNACPSGIKFPALPSTMNGLTYVGANNIEQVLVIASEYVSGGSTALGSGILGQMVLGK